MAGINALYRVQIINDFSVTGLTASKRQLESYNQALNQTTTRQKSLFQVMTRARIAFFNVAVVASIATGVFYKLRQPSIQLETAMADVRKTTNLTKGEIADLKDELITLSQEIPISAKELADIAVIAGQLGIHGEKSILAFTRTVGLMTIATEMSAEKAATNLAKVSAAFDIPIAQISRVGSVINELSNTTAATSTQISNALVRAGVAASSLGIDFETTSAALATLISAGMGAERSGTRLNTLFIKMGSNAEGFARIAGVSTEAYLDLLNTDAPRALDAVLRGLNDNEAGVINLSDAYDVAGRVAGLALSTLAQQQEDLTKNINTANKAWEENISLVLEASKRAETTASQWQLLKNELMDILYTNNNLTRSLIEGTRSIIEYGKALDFLRGYATTANPIAAFFYTAQKASKRGTEELVSDYGETLKLLKESGVSEDTINKVAEYFNTIESGQQQLDFLKNINNAYSQSNEELIGSLEQLSDQLKNKNVKIFDELQLAIAKANSEIENGGQLTPEFRDELNRLSIEAEKVKKAFEIPLSAEFFDDIAEGLAKLRGETIAPEDFLSGFKELFELSKVDMLNKVLDQTLANYKQYVKDINQQSAVLKSQGKLGLTPETFEQRAGASEETLRAYIEYVRKSEEVTDKWRAELSDVGNQLSNIRDQIKNAEGIIRTILSRRFEIRGISETEIIGLIERQEIELKKAEFATLGLGTAEDFLRNASLITADAIDQQTDAVKKLTEAASDGEDQFTAWQTALRETIKALLISSQDIDRDVTDVVRRAQTELLGISQFGGGGVTGTTVQERNLQALGLAQDIFFGEERQKLQQSEREYEDRTNGLNESAAQAIAAIEAQRATILGLEAQEATLMARQTELQQQLDDFSTKNAIDELEKLRSKIHDTKEVANELSGALSKTGGGGTITGVGGQEPDWKTAKITPISGGGGSSIISGVVNSALLNPSLISGFNDFISRPGQPVAQFSPQDTIVGFKGNAIGPTGNNLGPITINITGNNKNAREIAQEVKRELMSLA